MTSRTPSSPPRPASDRARRGRAAETLVATRLESLGWTILGRNLSTRRGEIDILARSGGTLHVVEVRSRSSTGAGTPAETVGRRKRARIAAAVADLSRLGRLPRFREIRYDVASVVWGRSGNEPEIEIVENAFEALDLL